MAINRREFLQTAAVGGAGLAGVVQATQAQAEEQAVRPINVLVWDEQQEEQITSGAYEDYIGNTIAADLAQLPGVEVVSANLNEPEQGLSAERINAADVIFWWGHQHHGRVDDARVERVVNRVRAGNAGFVALHSAHFAKPFVQLMGTRCGFRRVDSRGGEGFHQHVRVTNPTHPLVEGVADFEVPRTEIYAEPFEVPMPEGIVLYGYWEETGEAFPEMCYWTVGRRGVPDRAGEIDGGRVVYLRLGHETFPIFKQEELRVLLRNAARFAAA